MKKMRFILPAAMLACVAQPALAADFTFDVPVSLANVPSGQRLTVSCYVSKAALDEPTRAGGTNVVGRGSAAVPIVNGNFDGVVTVEVNAEGLNPAASGRSYTCSMAMSGTARTGSAYRASVDNFARVYEDATGTALESVKTSVSANLP